MLALSCLACAGETAGAGDATSGAGSASESGSTGVASDSASSGGEDAETESSGGDAPTETETGSETGAESSSDSAEPDPCPLCCPDERRCVDARAEQCSEDGEAWLLVQDCDAQMGLECDEELAACVGSCALSELGASNLGCEFYPTVTQQEDEFDSAPLHFAVALLNPGGSPASVVVTRGEDLIVSTAVAANSVELVELPWIPALTNGSGPSKRVDDGAYRLRSDEPLVAYQYNPLTPELSADASLLLPVHTWGPRVVVAAWRHTFGFWNFPSMYTVVAAYDQTTLTLTPSATGGQVQAGSGVASDGTALLTLERGDVVQVLSAGGDLSGTVVTADRPVQVIGGHECAQVPVGVGGCDHLEESILPARALGSEYIVAPPVQVPDSSAAKATAVRVIATQAQTSITFTPDQGRDQVLADTGDWLELSESTAAFRVSASAPVLVAQYMLGEGAGYGQGDPAMLVLAPISGYRSEHAIFIPPSWTPSFVDLSAPSGASVSVDGVELGPESWAEIPGAGFAVAHLALDGLGDGRHFISADVDVGVSVYGLVGAASTWYTGGVALTPQPP